MFTALTATRPNEPRTTGWYVAGEASAASGGELFLRRWPSRTTLVSLHDLNAAASVCDRLHVLHGGTVVASGPPREVLTPVLLAEVFGVRAAVVDHPLTGDPLIAFDHRAPADGVVGEDMAAAVEA